ALNEEAELEMAAAAPAAVPGTGSQFTAQRPAPTGRFAAAPTTKTKAARRTSSAPIVTQAEPAGLTRYVPWAAAGLGVLYLIVMMAPPVDAPKDFHLQDFASLPIIDRGRVKPLDTFARMNLLVLSDRQSFQDKKGQSQPAIKWLLDVMTSNAAENYQV